MDAATVSEETTAGEPVLAAGALRLRRWSDRAIVAVAVMALASGFGQFSVVAALGDAMRNAGDDRAGQSSHA